MEKIVKTFKPNSKQQEAIDNICGQVMLLAGPGTGKTFTLIKRIEKMVSNGVNPTKILCLTFSDAAANEMRDRLIKALGIKGSSVNVFTYHSFCNEIIKQFPDEFHLSNSVRLINDTEKITIMKQCVDEANLIHYVAPNAGRYFYVPQFCDNVGKIKAQRISKDEYYDYFDTNPEYNQKIKELEDEIYQREQIGKMQNKTRQQSLEKARISVEKAKELFNLYELYSKKMRELNLIDFSDMINLVLDAFDEDPEFLNKVSNEYDHFLVDEYQDTNKSQNEVIFNLISANKHKNIFVVGDDDQIIYAFQGAKSDNLSVFINKFPDLKVICLNENNRSSQEVLDLSYKVISQDSSRLECDLSFAKYGINKELVAKNENIISKTQKIQRLQFAENIQELNFIVDEIENIINSSSCPVDDNEEKKLSEIAIICKQRSELLTLSELLKAKNIDSQSNSTKSIFEIRSSLILYFFLKILNNHIVSADKIYPILLSEPFKINNLDYLKILQKQREHKAHKEQFNLIDVLKSDIAWEDKAAIDNFLNTFFYMKKFIKTNTLRNSIIKIVNETGILSYFHQLDENKMENIMALKKVVDEARAFEIANPLCTIYDFTLYLDECVENEIEITLDKDPTIKNMVQLCTYHGSKGREFEYVFLPNLTADKWEKYRSNQDGKLVFQMTKEESQKDAENLKLLFVGITRAKYALYLSFSDYTNKKPKQITKYLSEIDYNFDSKQFEYKEEDIMLESFKIMQSCSINNDETFKDEITERIKSIVLSPSRLNDYLDCPRKFFYTKVLKIDIQEASWDAANFGSLIHKIFEKAANKAKNTQKYPEIESMLEEFKNEVEITKFSDFANQEKYVKQGLKIIENYYPVFSQIPPDRIFELEKSYTNIPIDKHFITGKIDRIEISKDGTYELYDFKTGSPKASTKVCVGGDFEKEFNQLCFYKYIFEKATGEKVSKVGLIFPQDPQKNVYRELDESDLKYIEELIKNVYQDINSHKFEPNLASKGCKYCNYSHICKLNVL